VQFLSSSNRLYTLLRADGATNTFNPVPGRVKITGNGALQTLTDTNVAGSAFYRVEVSLP
jgi:hypothetical protein